MVMVADISSIFVIIARDINLKIFEILAIFMSPMHYPLSLIDLIINISLQIMPDYRWR